MYSLSVVVLACVITAVVTAGACWVAARTWVDSVRDAERRQADEALRHAREEYARDLHELQTSLATEVDALRDRAQHPIRALVDSFFS